MNYDDLILKQKLAIRTKTYINDRCLTVIKEGKQSAIDEHVIILYIDNVIKNEVDNLVIVTNKGVTTVMYSCELYNYMTLLHYDDIVEVIKKWIEKKVTYYSYDWGFYVSRF